MAQPVFFKETYVDDPQSRHDQRYFSFAEAHKAACTGCGQCCRSWGISIEEDRMERVEAYFRSRGFYPEDKRLFEEVEKETPKGEKFKQWHITLEGDGVCPFLDQDDNKCLIHKHLGWEAKGTTCQVFPKQPFYLQGVGGIDGLFFSSNYMLDLLFSDKPLDMVSVGSWTDKEAADKPYENSRLTPNDLIAITRVYSRWMNGEPSYWKAGGTLVLFHLFCEQEAEKGNHPSAWNTAKAERHLKEALQTLVDMPFSLGNQILILRALVADAFQEKHGGALIGPSLAQLYRDRDGNETNEPNLIRYHRLLRRHGAALAPVLDRVYRRFIAFKNYGLTFDAQFGVNHGRWLLLFHLALTRTVALVLMDTLEDITPEKAVRETIFSLERDFIHNGLRVAGICDGFLKPYLQNPATSATLAKPR